jgi:nucleotide-binding universal stress UspA family protein
MPRRATGAKPTIVVGYDGSEAARAAVTLAARRAGQDGRLVIVHSYGLPPDFLGLPNFDQLLTDRRAHGQAVLDDLLLEGNDEVADVDYETELLGGPPAQVIVDIARAYAADEILLGTRGLSRARAALGSVSHEVLHLADRPVTIVPSRNGRHG